MSPVGPQLPPHLQAKRKRSEEKDDELSVSPKGARSASCDEESTPRRIIGPAAPPAPLSERPLVDPEPDLPSSSSDDDDDFGPSLPPAPGSTKQIAEAQRQQKLEDDFAAREAAKKPQREEWMIVPPKQDDWSSRVDPTKLRNRKFNTGKGAKAPAEKGGESALWTETPEQKRQRLEDEVMGIKKPAQLGAEDKRDKRKEQEAREMQKKIEEYNEKKLKSSIDDELKNPVPAKEKEDDPGARAFDKEKDMGLGMKVGHAQRREMMNRAKDFGSRFAGGNYL